MFLERNSFLCGREARKRLSTASSNTHRLLRSVSELAPRLPLLWNSVSKDHFLWGLFGRHRSGKGLLGNRLDMIGWLVLAYGDERVRN